MSRRAELVGGPQDGRIVNLDYADTPTYHYSSQDHGHYEFVDGTSFFRWVPE